MPRTTPSRTRRLRRYWIASAFAIVLLLSLPGVSSAWVLNQAQLDYGYCSQNLQTGSDVTASQSTTPSFVLTGDGTTGSYQMFIDGNSIGTFNTDVYGNVCIYTTAPLAQGPHVLTGNELKPNPSNTVPAFNFSVDSIAPPAPSAPTLAFTSDTGVKGDNITNLHTFTVTGTSATGVGITGINASYASGSRYFGGASPTGTGSWSIVGSVPSDGVYMLQATASDEAANVSPQSAALTVTVDSVAPTSSVTSPAAGATVAGTVNAAASASDTGSGVASVAFQVDGVTKVTDTASPYTYAWNTTAVANGQHTLTEVATDVAGNKSTSSVTVDVENGAGATAPGAPTLNSATPGNGSAALAWSAPSSDGGSAITGYKVYRGTTSGGETLLTTLGNVTSWNDTNAANGTTYYYKLSAVNAVGESAVSNELSATPATVPGAPTLNNATPGNGSVALMWSPPSSNGGSATTGYKVYRGTTSGGETLLTTLGNVTSWTDNNAANGTAYYYKVTAVNSVGEGTASNELSATPATVPGAPTLNSANAGNGSVALSWSAPGSNGGSATTAYRVYRGTTSGGETLLTTLGNVTSWTDTNTANGTTYYYKLSAVNAVGEGATSNELSATPATVPGTPTLNSANAGNGSVALAWSAPGSNGGSAITAYKVYRGTSSGGETLLTTLGNVTSWTDTNAANGTTYYYKVSAVNSVGEGAASNEKSGTPATVPGGPALNNATAGNGSVALAWSAPGSNGGSAITAYKVYRGTSSGGETLLTTLGNVTSWTDNNTANGTTYYYEVSAVNSMGEGVASNERSATPSQPANVPSAPALTSAAGGNASVALTWNAPSNNGGSAVTGYKVYRGTSSGNETLLTSLGVVTGWTDSSVTNGTTYYYKVSAVNSVGESAASNELSATPSQPATAPSAPSLNAATPGNGSVALAWSAPSDNGGSAITGYRVYRGTSSGGETLLTTLGGVTSWTDTGLTSGTTYYYKVTALNSVGESARSNELSAKPVTVPGAPALNSATAGSATVALAWSAPSNNGGSAISGYRVYRGTSSGSESLLTTLGNVTSWTDTGLTNGTAYYYTVTAVNAAGESATSNERSATPASATVPGAPVLVSVSSGRHGVSLTWNAPTSNGGSPITGYRVYRSTMSGGETLIATLGNVTSWVDTTSQGGTVYYEVTAVNAVGESARSNELSTGSGGKGHK
jgi:fibronectin type 3 domain-containing protein